MTNPIAVTCYMCDECSEVYITHALAYNCCMDREEHDAIMNPEVV